MEIRGDLSYWLARVRTKATEGPRHRLGLPDWLILSPRNWAEIKHLLKVNEIMRYYTEPKPNEPPVFCGLKVAIADLYNGDADFLEVA